MIKVEPLKAAGGRLPTSAAVVPKMVVILKLNIVGQV